MDSKEEVLLEMADIMQEFSNFHESYMWELGHYLADTLLLKIGIYFIEQKVNKKLSNTNFVEIYKKLKIYYPKIPDYNIIRPLHEERNIFSHKSDSIEFVVRKERAKEYSERVKEIMVFTGLISNKNEIYGTSYLKTEHDYMEGSEIEEFRWTELVNLSKIFYELWINCIANKKYIKEKNESNLVKIMFYIRGITKASTNLENFHNFNILELNRSFEDIIINLQTLVSYFAKLLNNDGNRIIALYHEQIVSSDQKYILQSLNTIKHLTKARKNKFDYERFISAIQLLGIGINLFLHRYIEHIDPRLKWKMGKLGV